MKTFANILMVTGALVAVIAFNLDVTVGGAGIANLNMMAQRQNLLIVGCVGFLAGIVLLIGTQQQGGSKAHRKIEERNENETTTDVGVGVRLSLAIKTGSDFFEKYVSKGDTFVHFLGKFTGSVYSACIGKSIVKKIVSSLVHSDFFYGRIDIGLWEHTEIFYIPVMVFIFLAVMRNGFDILVRVFYVEIATCIAAELLFILIFGGDWLTILEFFSFELGLCALGIVLIKKFGSKILSLVG